MQEDQIKQIVDKNFHITLMLGYALALLSESSKYVPDEQENFHIKLEWLNQAIENVIYIDCPPPAIP